MQDKSTRRPHTRPTLLPGPRTKHNHAHDKSKPERQPNRQRWHILLIYTSRMTDNAIQPNVCSPVCLLIPVVGRTKPGFHCRGPPAEDPPLRWFGSGRPVILHQGRKATVEDLVQGLTK